MTRLTRPKSDPDWEKIAELERSCRTRSVFAHYADPISQHKPIFTANRLGNLKLKLNEWFGLLATATPAPMPRTLPLFRALRHNWLPLAEHDRAPFTRRHYVSHTPMDHTVVIKFVER